MTRPTRSRQIIFTGRAQQQLHALFWLGLLYFEEFWFGRLTSLNMKVAALISANIK